MKKKINRLIALLLSVLLLAVLTAGCSKPAAAPAASSAPQAEESAEAPEVSSMPEEPEQEPVEEAQSEVPEEQTEEAAPPEEEKDPIYPEAMELLGYLGAVDTASLKASDALTGAVANQMLGTLGLSQAALPADAAVTGAQFLPEALQLLGYGAQSASLSAENLLQTAQKQRLLSGMADFDASAAMTVEQGAQILRNALLSYTVDDSAGAASKTTKKLADTLNLKYVVIPDFQDGFNRPGGKWVAADSNADVTGTYVASPVVSTGDVLSWCQVLELLGYAKDDSANNPMITFQNSLNGTEFTEKFEKCHWGDASDPHSGCANDFTNELTSTMEIYQISETEYRNVFRVNFLAKVSDGSITLYGYNDETWGPWANDGLPADGYYITNYFWNAYGAGEGYNILGPAITVTGTLEAITDTSATVDGVEMPISYVFNLGSKIAKSSIGVGQKFTFYLDPHNNIVGCAEYVG